MRLLALVSNQYGLGLLALYKHTCRTVYTIYSCRLSNQLKESEELDRNYKELKIEREPWDRYDVLDSHYYYPMLLTNRSLTVEEQILVLHFVLRAVELGMLSRCNKLL